MATMLPRIIGIIGPIRSGKTTAAEYLVRRYGYKHASNSEILRHILAAMEMSPTRSNLSRLGDAIFSVLGNDIIAQYRLDRLDKGIIVVDGIRYPEELVRYSREPTFKLLALAASDEARFRRAQQDLEGARLKDAGLTREKFDGLSAARSELDVPRLMLKADAVIENNNEMAELERKIDEVITGWGLS